MTVWLAGMRITEERLEDVDVVTQSVGVVYESGWAAAGAFSGRKCKGMTTIELFVDRSGGAISESGSNTGNLSPDLLICTLPVGWRPRSRHNCVWGNGFNDGEASIGADGGVTLRSTSGTAAIGAGSNVRISGVWASEESN